MKQMKDLIARRGPALLLALSLLLTVLSGCGEDDTATDQQQTEETASESPEATGEPAQDAADESASESEPDPVELALEQYRTVVGQADTYDYGSTDAPTGAYRYALVRMDPEDAVPVLLLEQDTTFGISSVLVFQYDTDGGTVLQTSGTLMEGVASAGGYRGSLSAAGDGNGLLSAEYSSGTGEGWTSRVTLDGAALQSETIWEGVLGDGTDNTDEEIGYLEIGWHETADLSGLDSWTPPAAVSVQTPASEPEPTGTALPADGDRIVFRGTLNAYSHSEVVALQGQGDPEADRGETYYLIVLDAPQTMTVTRGDGSGSRDGEVHLVDVTYAEGIAQYVGQNLVFSIDPARTYWPSDASLPLGEPRTDDIRVLS